MSAKYRNSTTKDVAVLQNDLKWIRGKLEEISKVLESIKLCTDGHDNKISRCEAWMEAHDALEENKKEEKKMSMTKVGLMISAAAALTGVVIFALQLAFGR